MHHNQLARKGVAPFLNQNRGGCDIDKDVKNRLSSIIRGNVMAFKLHDQASKDKA